MRRLITTVLALALLAIAGIAPSWASPRDRPSSTTPAATAHATARTAADLPDPPRAMTLAERRKQVARDRHELSPARRCMTSHERKLQGKPHSRPEKGGPNADQPPREPSSL
ncbi:hypothetical protein [Streptomyces sp. NPDC050121]|uniref:hypothetical protein n=1 Tax=Streptomyces sp. NPDC050121 TaxID=3365601 RepID=UPI00379FBB73